MRRPKRTRTPLGALLALALGALALAGLAGMAVAKDDSGHHRGNHGENRHHRGTTGTIASFDADTGRLVIDLFGKDTVGGTVTNRTKIKCEDENSPDVSDRHGEDEPGEDHQGENSGPGSSHSGPSGHDDNGTGANCTASDLIVDAVVREAELEIEHGRATFEEVELAE